MVTVLIMCIISWCDVRNGAWFIDFNKILTRRTMNKSNNGRTRRSVINIIYLHAVDACLLCNNCCVDQHPVNHAVQLQPAAALLLLLLSDVVCLVGEGAVHA